MAACTRRSNRHLRRHSLGGPSQPRFTRFWLVTFVVAVCLLLLLATEYHAEVGFLTRPKLYPSPEGWTGYPQLGTLAALQFAVLAAVLVTERRPLPLVCATVLLVIGLVELGLLYARGAWLAAGLGLIALPAVLSSWKQARRVLVAATVVCLLTASAVAWNPLLRRLALGDTTADLNGYTLELASPEMRLDLYRRSARMARDYAMTGVGLELPARFRVRLQPRGQQRWTPRGACP